ncbi:ATP-binding protein [Jatrophihabitans sp. YIM 134969]
MTAVDVRLEPSDAVALLERQTEILEQIATGTPLAVVLTGIAATLEDLVPGCWCSVLLLDRGPGVLRHGAAPSLPAAYCASIDGLAIGAVAGSCGTAAYSGRSVVAVDIRSDDRWVDYRELAEGFGLRACWSTPIGGRDGVSGTFAVYHRDPHRPTAREEQLVERLTHLASVAIDHAAAEQERHRRIESELARSAAEAANRAKTDFVAALGHELRTPLQAITGFTEVLGTLDLDDERRTAALHHITAAAGHILEIVGDVLDVARIETNALPLTLRDVAVPEVVEEVVAMVRPLAAAERVTLRLEPSPDVLVRADERRVTQVLLNLVTNAIRYNRDDGAVSVAWSVVPSATGDTVCVTVRDTGPGIAAEHRDRLFTPFDRLGRDCDEGVGLGLPLARGLTEAMGGHLDVESEVGTGTTAAMVLPVSPTS